SRVIAKPGKFLCTDAEIGLILYQMVHAILGDRRREIGGPRQRIDTKAEPVRSVGELVGKSLCHSRPAGCCSSTLSLRRRAAQNSWWLAQKDIWLTRPSRSVPRASNKHKDPEEPNMKLTLKTLFAATLCIAAIPSTGAQEPTDYVELEVGRTRILCYTEPCPWNGIADAD